MIRSLTIIFMLLAVSGCNVSPDRRFLCADFGASSVYLVDENTDIVWKQSARTPHDAWMLADDSVLFAHHSGAKIVDRDKNVLWEYKAPKGAEVVSVQPLDNGNILVGECGTCRLLEIDENGRIARQIALKTKTKRAHEQMRISRKTPEGTYLVAFKGEGVVREYASDGSVIRSFGGLGDPFVAVRLENGNTLIACGDAHRLVEIAPDDSVVWEIKKNDIPGHPLRFVAGVQRLANGNTVICNWGGHGHIGQQAQIIEVTPDKRVVWQIYDFEKFGTPANIHLYGGKGRSLK